MIHPLVAGNQLLLDPVLHFFLNGVRGFAENTGLAAGRVVLIGVVVRGVGFVFSGRRVRHEVTVVPEQRPTTRPLSTEPSPGAYVEDSHRLDPCVFIVK